MALRDLVDEIKKVDAVTSLRPTANWVMADDELTWLDGSQTEPTQAEIDAEIARLKTEFTANAYQRTRADAYKEVKEQLDQLYHDMAANKGDKTGTWFAAVKAVKDATPKP